MPDFFSASIVAGEKRDLEVDDDASIDMRTLIREYNVLLSFIYSLFNSWSICLLLIQQHSWLILDSKLKFKYKCPKLARIMLSISVVRGE